MSEEDESEVSRLRTLFREAKDGIDREAEVRSISWIKCFHFRLRSLAAQMEKPESVQALGDGYEDARRRLETLSYKIYLILLKNPYASTQTKGATKTSFLKELDNVLPNNDQPPP